jgi:uncharacterized protein YeaC (DUF1315 family)
MDIKQLLETITPEVYTSLKRAIELGKWGNGQRLDKEQKELCMQAVIAYEKTNLPEDQHTGYIPPKPHSHCGGSGDVAEPTTPTPTTTTETPLKWH